MPQGSVHWQGTQRRACGPGANWNVQVNRYPRHCNEALSPAKFRLSVTASRSVRCALMIDSLCTRNVSVHLSFRSLEEKLRPDASGTPAELSESDCCLCFSAAAWPL